MRVYSAMILAVSAAICGSAVAGNTGKFPKPEGDAAFDFALIGDTPYGAPVGVPYQPLLNVISEINADPAVEFVVHTGDIKAGSELCSDELFHDRLAYYNRFDDPFILTPGDNEWTDCHRINNGGYQPLERLAKLREIFYAEPGTTLGARRGTVDFQPGYPENVRFVHRGVVFATLHVVGSQNGLAPFQAGSPAVRSADDDAEVAARELAVLNWIDAAFDLAESTNAPGVLLAMQADMAMEAGLGSPDRAAFENILARLEARTKAFAKPVVLAHGDSHYFRVDKVNLSSNDFLANFTRVENFGSSQVHWVRIRVRPGSDDVFYAQPEIVDANVE